jgi:acetyl esterase/lipase
MLRIAILALTFTASLSAAQPLPLQLWPHGAPGETENLGAGKNTTKPSDNLVGGKSVIRLGDVGDPKITVYLAANPAATHPAIVVFPGGGYYILAMDLEGTEICRWLNAQGITAVLLKYRVPRRKGRPVYEAPLQDAQRAISLVRHHAKQWHIAPNRIGVLGFSAGGDLAALVSTRFIERSYALIDAADRVSCRPDFAALVYPAYLTRPPGSDKLAPELTVSSQIPPTFLVQAEDDPVHVENSLFYYLALKRAHVPAEMHLFSKGGHGYGLRDTSAPVNRWPFELKAWLACDLKILPGERCTVAAE